MGKQTFGGDDDDEEVTEEVQKKLKLSKFELAPDYNIRDLFWKIMASYAATKTPGIDLSKIENERIPLVRVAVSVMESKRSSFYGLSPQFVSRYVLMMTLDGGWKDAFIEFLEHSKESKGHVWKSVVQAFKHLLSSEKYRAKTFEYYKAGIRDSDVYPYILFYLPRIKDRGLVRELKKEVSIYARGDIDENQINAIDAIALLSDEEDMRNVLLSLLNHWDVNIRRKAAEKIKKIDGKAADLIKRRIEAEPDEEIKKMLKRKVSRWKKR